jgi:DNA-binding IclR family transcriptional regulator
VDKAFSVIGLLRRSRLPLTHNEIARSVKIAPTTAQSIISELTAEGIVIPDGDRGYCLGPSLFYYGTAYARSSPIYETTWHDLVGLSHELSLTAAITVPLHDHHLILNVHTNGSAGIEVAFGRRIPIDAGAWGKAYFAWSDAGLPNAFVGHTPKSIVDPVRYAEEIARTRTQGFAVDEEEFVLGAGAVAAAVTGEHGLEGIAALVGLISEIGAAGEANVGRRLAIVASQASQTLGDFSRSTAVGNE